MKSILDWTKFRAFTDNKLNVAEMKTSVFDGRKHYGKIQNFLLFPKFQKSSLCLFFVFKLNAFFNRSYHGGQRCTYVFPVFLTLLLTQLSKDTDYLLHMHQRWESKYPQMESFPATRCPTRILQVISQIHYPSSYLTRPVSFRIVKFGIVLYKVNQ